MTKENMTAGANSSDLQQMNRILVLTLLRKLKATTRAELAGLTGLKRATITNIINDFIQCKIVKETGIVDGKRGRRSIQIAIDPGDRRVIAVRLARKDFTIGLFDILGNIFYQEVIPLDIKEGSRYALELIKEKLSHLFTTGENIFAIGVALPGPYLKDEDRIVQISDFPGWEGVSIVEELANAFHVPVYAEHDCNASVLAEWWFGNNISSDDNNKVLLNILAGQGIGAGLIENGVIYRGSHGLSGELGHSSVVMDGPRCVCGNRGCLDLYCSSIVLMQNIARKRQDYPDSVLSTGEITLERIHSAVECGDSLAVNEVKAIAGYLGRGIVTAIKIYDPDLVVIGDELAFVGGQCLLDEVLRVVRDRMLPSIMDRLVIKLSTIENPMLSGAMCVAVDNFFRNLEIL